jgi:adenosylhomocysteinase
MEVENMPASIIRDPELAPQGRQKIAWVQKHMPILNEIRRDFEGWRPFAGQRVAICLHLEAKTAYLALVLQACGAEVAICGSNPLSTQDDVAAGLASLGVAVYARHGCTAEEYNLFLERVLDTRPTLVIDDGGDLVHLLHTGRRELLAGIIGGAEETTTGILRLQAMEAEGALAFPMVAVNNGDCKHLFDNRYGTGQSTWDGIMRTTNLTVCGKAVVVAGYGWCGKGVAMRAKGLGARVIITEVDPIRAIEALMDGFEVMPMAAAALAGDIFVTVTGCAGVIRAEHYAVMKDGAILANAGHFDVEIDKGDLLALATSHQVVRNNIEEFVLADGRRIYLLAEGRPKSWTLPSPCRRYRCSTWSRMPASWHRRSCP